MKPRRRTLLVAAIGWPLAALAQQPKSIYRIGFLSNGPAIEPPQEAFRQRLRELGYADGKNAIIEWRFNKGDLKRNPEMAAELVAQSRLHRRGRRDADSFREGSNPCDSHRYGDNRRGSGCPGICRKSRAPRRKRHRIHRNRIRAGRQAPGIPQGAIRGRGFFASPQRLPPLPDVPTFDEAELKGFEASSWFGVVATARTPKEVVARLGSEIGRALRDAELQNRFAIWAPASCRRLRRNSRRSSTPSA